MKIQKKLMISLLVSVKLFLLIIMSCEKEMEDPVDLPTLTTISITDITSNSANSGGNIINNGGAEITSRGLVWGTTANPTLEQHTGLTVDGSGEGLFSSNLSNLSPSTTYFVRSYAINSAGTSYGDELSFNTENEKKLPSIITEHITNITQNSAIGGGEVTDDGGASVIQKGICWSKSPGPTITDNHTNDGTGVGHFTSSFEGLEPQTQYYVRAYAINEVGIVYGQQIVFSTIGHQAWTQKANFGGSGRSFATGFSIHNKGYIGTGLDNNFRKDFWEYDPTTNSWSQKASFGGDGRFCAVSFSISYYGYLGTGSRPTNIDPKEFWGYNPYTNTWTKKSSYPGAALALAVGFAIGDKGYIGTGGGTRDQPYLKDFWEYDPASNSWTQKADFAGSPRHGAVGFTIGRKGYIGTGKDEFGSLKDFWEYNPETNIWTQKADFGGTARYDAIGFAMGEKGYIGTGRETGAASRKDIWEYNPLNDSWTRKSDIPGPPRWGAVAFSIGNKGYAGLGFDGQNDLRDFYEYDPSWDQ